MALTFLKRKLLVAILVTIDSTYLHFLLKLGGPTRNRTLRSLQTRVTAVALSIGVYRTFNKAACEHYYLATVA